MKEEIFLSVIIPSLNEEKRITPTLDDVARYLKTKPWKAEVIIADGGSIDRTREIVENKKHLFENIHFYVEKGSGKGNSVKQAMFQAKGKYRMFMDADNSTTVPHLDKFLPFLDKYQIIIGSRYLHEGDIRVEQPFLRRMISRGGNLLIRLFILPGIVDTQCGFKLFEAEAAKKIFSRQTISGYGFDMEILTIARFLGYKIKEVAVKWVDVTGGTIKNPFKTAFRTLFDLLRIKFYLVSGRYKNITQ